jgi:hypothetical protein
MPNISFYCQEEFEASSYKWLHTKTQPIGHRIRLHQPFSVNYFSTKQKFMIYVHLPVHEVLLPTLCLLLTLAYALSVVEFHS